MKVLLVSINAKYIHSNNAVRLLKANSDFDIEIIEFTIKDRQEQIIRLIQEKEADVIGFSVYIWNVEIIKEILPTIKTNSNKIVLGGPEVSYEASFFMNNLPVDFIVKGEGEITFNSLLHAVSTNEEVANIPSLVWRDNDKIKQTAIKEIEDLSTLESPHFYEDDKKHIPNKISYIESSRGCPYKCSYCISSLEKKVRFFPLEQVKKEIYYLMNHGSKTIKFLDRTFNANKNTIELLDYIIQIDNHKTVFQFEITGDILDPTIIHHIHQHARKGLFRFEIGIQSIHYETNYLVDRFQDTNKLFSNIKLIQEAGIIDLHLDLIAGLPKESLPMFKITFNEVYLLGAKELQLGFLKLLRGTKIRLEADKYDYQYMEQAPYEVISNHVLSEEDIMEIKMVEDALDLFHNRGYFLEHMQQLITTYKTPYDFFYDIGIYLKQHFMKNKQYQLEDIYQIAMDFFDTEETAFLLKKDYLQRAKIKPKVFWDEVVSKKLKSEIFHKIQNVPLHQLYKNSVIISYNREYFVAFYKDFTVSTFSIHLP